MAHGDGAIRHWRSGLAAGMLPQHMIIEYARNVLGFEDAQHAEYDPYQSRLFVTPLSELAAENVHLVLG
jgi:CTP synthase (UTP-ammonia lyase)